MYHASSLSSSHRRDCRPCNPFILPNQSRLPPALLRLRACVRECDKSVNLNRIQHQHASLQSAVFTITISSDAKRSRCDRLLVLMRVSSPLWFTAPNPIVSISARFLIQSASSKGYRATYASRTTYLAPCFPVSLMPLSSMGTQPSKPNQHKPRLHHKQHWKAYLKN